MSQTAHIFKPGQLTPELFQWINKDRGKRNNVFIFGLKTPFKIQHDRYSPNNIYSHLFLTEQQLTQKFCVILMRFLSVSFLLTIILKTNFATMMSTPCMLWF